MSTATQATKRNTKELPASPIPAESTAARAKKMRETAKQPSAHDLAVTITLNALHRGVEALGGKHVEASFESGLEQDADAGWAMDMVTAEIKSMMSRNVSPGEFEAWLYGLGGIISCAYRSLSNKDVAYARHLLWIQRSIDVFGDMIGCAEHAGPKFLQREVQS